MSDVELSQIKCCICDCPPIGGCYVCAFTSNRPNSSKHVTCRSCLGQIGVSPIVCPLCRAAIPSTIDASLTNEIAESWFSCPWGCPRPVSGPMLHKHQRVDCDFRLVQCEACDMFMAHADAHAHRQFVCSAKDVTCRACQITISPVLFQFHDCSHCTCGCSRPTSSCPNGIAELARRQQALRKLRHRNRGTSHECLSTSPSILVV